MEITLIKTLGGLKLCYDSDLEKYKKLPLNEPIEFKYTRKRNLKFHKLFFFAKGFSFLNILKTK